MCGNEPVSDFQCSKTLKILHAGAKSTMYGRAANFEAAQYTGIYSKSTSGDISLN